jgi:hypothetical protein
MRSALLSILLGVCVMSGATAAASRNRVLGTWQMVSAQIDRDGKSEPAYGRTPSGLLSFTPNMHYIEVLTDADIPRFASELRGQGTDAENRIVMATNIGMFGTYTVDEKGEFSGDRVEGSTFPNWIGNVRTRKELRIIVDGDQMTEHFQRPDGTKITIVLGRVR